MRSVLLGVIACLGVGAAAAASVRIPGATGINDGTDFPCVGRITTGGGSGTGTVIGNGMWVLTSRHVVCDGMNMPLPAGDLRFRTGVTGQTSHVVTQVVCHPTADIALLKLDDMLTDTYAISSAALHAGDLFCTAGWGVGSDNSGTPGATWDLEAARRVYYNTVSTMLTQSGVPYVTYDYTCPPVPPATTPRPVNGEGIGGEGDSGQPMLVRQPDNSLAVQGVYQGNDGDGLPTWGAVGVFVRIDANLGTWIGSNIPGPGVGAGLVVGMGVMGVRRRRGG